MEAWYYIWRGEISISIAILITWFLAERIWRRSFWVTFLPGALLGCMIEFMTEPEWTYFAQWFVWRDVSPMIILGWGVVYTWLVVISDKLQKWWLKNQTQGYRRRIQVALIDFMVALPMFLGNELFGLYGIKIWQYNAILGWTTMIPILHYPLEGLYSMVFFALVTPWVIRYWMET